MGNATNSSGFGFRVLKTHPGSPASEAGIRPFLDFIVNIELTHSELKEANVSNIQVFFNTIVDNENKEIHVTLFNIYDRQLRKVRLVPHKNWPSADSLLGVLLRYEEYMTALERTYKVIQVLPGSVAEKLGFVEEYDYILGLTNYQYKDLGELIRLLFKAEEICVFNIKEGKTRFIQLPKEKCVLGCQFGEGILNQLPYKHFEMPLIEELHSKSHEDEITNLTEDISSDHHHQSNKSAAHPDPQSPQNKPLEAPPKKNELPPEKEHKSIGLEDSQQSKNYQELLKPSCSKSTLDYIHQKRTEHLKKNVQTGARFAPKNPFQSPTHKQDGLEEKEMNKFEEKKENLKEKEIETAPKTTVNELLKEAVNEPVQEIIKEGIKEEGNSQETQLEKEKTELESPSLVRVDPEPRKSEGEEPDENEEIQENGRIAKMVMKYSYYCPRLKDEYVINSSELVQMSVKIE